jgi:cytochrome c oxidase subunit 2
MSIFPPEATETARHVDWLCLGLLAVTGTAFLFVVIPLTYFAIKYRQGSRADRTNPPRGAIALELTWTIIPAFIFLGLFAWGADVYFEIERPPSDALQVNVVGKQWMWKLQHAEGKREINQLHIPLGETVKLTMASQDVIHAFYIPAFRVKQDVVPGRYTYEWFKPIETGTFHLFCSDYCGTDHSAMIGQVIVMQPSEYERWLTTGDSGVPVAMGGWRLYQQLGCSGCHGDNSSIHAPRLEGIFGHPVPLSNGSVVVADERYIRDSILLPEAEIVAGYQPLMPSFKGRVTEDEVLQLIDYIKSIANEEPPARAREERKP